MVKVIYTLWKSKEDDEDNALLLESEKLYFTKYGAFKRAKKLVKTLAKGWGLEILVRKIRYNSNLCEEWIFKGD